MIKGLACPYGRNNLIHTLPRADRARIEPHLRRVELDKGAILEEAGQPIGLVYFPTSGVASTVATGKNGCRIEVGLFGCDGMSGTAVVLQSERSSDETFMQIGGDGLAIDAGRLQELLAQNPSLQRHLLRYAQTLVTQISQTALANGQSKLEERLARWLLMCHDRISGNTVDLTHDLLSIMLGVRRAGVTVGTHVLEGKGLIRASRGQIVILDRERLEIEAQGSYGVPEAEYARLIGFRQPAENSEDQPSAEMTTSLRSRETAIP